MTRHYMLQDPSAGFYAVDVYATSKREARNAYRAQWYKGRQRLPRGVAVWEASIRVPHYA